MDIFSAGNLLIEENFITKLLPKFISKHLKPTIEGAGDDEYVKLSGFNTTTLRNALNKQFGKAGSTNIFHEISARSISIHKWFMPELLHMIEETLKYDDVPTRLLKELQTQLVTETWYKGAVESPVKVLDRTKIKRNLKWEPMKVQLEYLDLFDQAVGNFGFRGALAALAPGL